MARENNWLNKLVANLSLEKEMLQEVLRKNLKAASKRELEDRLIKASRVSTRRASSILVPSISSYYDKAHPRDDRAERARIKEIAENTTAVWYAAYSGAVAA